MTLFCQASLAQTLPPAVSPSAPLAAALRDQSPAPVAPAPVVSPLVVAPNPTPVTQPTPSQGQAAKPGASPEPTPAIPAGKIGTLEVSKGLPFAFGFQENGIELLPQEFDYTVEQSGLDLDGLKVDTSAQFLEVYREQNSIDYILKFSWSKNFMQSGEATVATADAGKTFFTMNISPKQVSEYVSMATKDSKEVLDSNQGHFETKITESALAQWDVNQPFRFCLKNHDNDAVTGLCSKYYRIEHNSSGYRLSPYRNVASKRVLIDDHAAPSTGSFSIKEKKTHFVCEFGNGSFFETDIYAVEPTFDELYQRKSDDKLVLRGHGLTPLDSTLTVAKYGWQVIFKSKDPFVYLPTKNGFSVKQHLKFHVPPLDEETRPYLMPDTVRGTYRDSIKLHGFLTGPLVASSSETEAHMTAVNLFDWTFNSGDKAQINKRRINFDHEDKTKRRYAAYYSVYRSLPYEVSGHLTGQFTDASNLLLEGGIFAQAWFEDIFNANSYNWSLQRWGVSADYYFPIINANNQYGHTVGYSTLDADIKYRLNPGVWNNETSYGVLLSYEKIVLNATSDSMLGIGGFFAEKMPKGIDNLLNHVGFLKHPKWIDAEFDYYPLAITSNVSQGVDLNLLLHAKMYLNPNFFTQLGLNYRRFYFTNNNDNIAVQNDLYAVSLGAGYNF